MEWLKYYSTIFWLILSGVCSMDSSRTPITLEYNLSEEVDSGTKVGNILMDGGFRIRYSQDVLKQLRFRFLSKPSVDFDLEMTTGSLFTSGRFDREKFCPMKELCVLKLDIAVQPVQYFQIIKVDIVVIDLNDNWPEFTESTASHQLPESAGPGTSISAPSAIDLDSPKFGITSYELVDNSDKFILVIEEKMDESIDVKLVLKHALNREVKSEYHIQLVAFDGGNLSGVSDIYIIILDVNDNNPYFMNHTYDVQVVENIPTGSTITRVQAFDPDEGVNGAIKYKFTTRTKEKFGSVFKIDDTTGDIAVKGEIDYEKHHVLHLGVVAEDRGLGTLPAETTVIVHVIDTNDNAPDITVNTLTGSETALVSEDSPIGTFVAHVTIVDSDSGINGEFDCHLVHNTLHLVKLYMNEYQVTTKLKLDRETKAFYDLEIACVDHGNPFLESSKKLRVIVGDANDNAPEFRLNSYLASIPENNKIGAVITQLNATDKDIDINAVLSYSLPLEDQTYFSINSDTGVVKALTVFDREHRNEVHFHVIATDKGSPSLSSSSMVLVTITDVNDEAPQFMQSGYSFGVFENEPPNAEVGQVGAIDRDDYPGNDFYYLFLLPDSNIPGNSASDPTDVFTINAKTGVINTVKPLDREMKSTYHFVIVAIDHGMPPKSSSTSVTIYVADQNDNVPIFEFPTPFNNTIKVPLKAHRGYVITRIIAKDFDLGQNAKLKYKFTNYTNSNGGGDNHKKDNQLFDIDPNYGIITVNKILTENDLDFHSLLITISDSGEVPNTVTTKLNILVDLSAVVLPGRGGIHQGSSEGNNGGDSFLASNNFAIIVSLAIVSGVVTLVLVIAIILIHRHNQAKKEQNYGRYNCRKEHMRIFPNMSRASDERTLTFNQSSSINASTFSEVAIRSKKEVSFSLDINNTTGNESSDSDVIRGAKRPDSRQSIPNSTIDHHALQHPQAQSSSLSIVTSSSSLPPNHITTAGGVAASGHVMGSNGSLGSRLEVIHEQHEEQRQLEMDRLMELLRRGGDNGSLGSNEGSVTDSGRGASEEGDMNTLSSHSHHSVDIPTFSHELPKRSNSPDNNQVVPNISGSTTPGSTQYDSCHVSTFLPQSSTRQPLSSFRGKDAKKYTTSRDGNHGQHGHHYHQQKQQYTIIPHTVAEINSCNDNSNNNNNNSNGTDSTLTRSNGTSASTECTILNETRDDNNYNNEAVNSEDYTKNAAFAQSTATFGDSVISDSYGASDTSNSINSARVNRTDFFYGSYLDYLKKKTSSDNSNPAIYNNKANCIGNSNGDSNTHQNNINKNGHRSSLHTLNETEDTDYTENGIDYSCQDMTDPAKLDRGVDEQSLPGGDDEDGASSTSGSYIVDPQALCNEIDQLFFTDTPGVH